MNRHRTIGKSRHCRRLIAMGLALLMAFTTIPVPVMAESNYPEDYDSSVMEVSSKHLKAPTLMVSNKESTGKPYLKWTSVNGAEKYEVYRAASKSGNYSLIFSTPGNSVTNSSAKAGITYYYKVRAISAGSKGEFSTVKTRTCDLARPNVVLTTRSDGKPVLSWEPIDGAVKYEVYRRVNGGNFERLITVTGTRLTNSSARNGETYTYKVRAIASRSSANSAYSYYDTITVNQASKLGSPSLTVTNKSSTGKPYLKWTSVSGAEKYEVYRSTSKDGTYSRLFTTGGNSLVNGSAKTARTYYYKVRAVTSNGNKGEFSSVKSRTCDLARPDVTLTIRSDGKPVLTWKAIDSAAKYEVYRRVNDGSFKLLSTVTGTRLTNSSAKSGDTYTYKVRAIASRSSANSAYSYYDTIVMKQFSVTWENTDNCNIRVERTATRCQGASIGVLNSGSAVYYGDQIVVSYIANKGYRIENHGVTSVTVTRNITSSDIYAVVKANSYTYDVVYQSTNGTRLGTSTVTNPYDSTHYIEPKQFPGYNTPSGKNVTWDSTDAEKIVFYYDPLDVSNPTQTGKLSDWEQSNHTLPTISYRAQFGIRNRTADSVEVRLTITETIKKSFFNNNTRRVKASVGDTLIGDVMVVDAWEWSNQSSSDRSKTVETDWVRVPISTTDATTVVMEGFFYETNSAGIHLEEPDGDDVYISWEINVPAY